MGYIINCFAVDGQHVLAVDQQSLFLTFLSSLLLLKLCLLSLKFSNECLMREEEPKITTEPLTQQRTVVT